VTTVSLGAVTVSSYISPKAAKGAPSGTPVEGWDGEFLGVVVVGVRMVSSRWPEFSLPAAGTSEGYSKPHVIEKKYNPRVASYASR
jgi:hypothetical protein